MNDREKQIRKFWRNPLIQQVNRKYSNQPLTCCRSYYGFDAQGLIKGKGYILTEQDYCVVVGAINMDIRGMADIRYPQQPLIQVLFTVPQAASGRNIAHNLALLGRDVHLISAVATIFTARHYWKKRAARA